MKSFNNRQIAELLRQIAAIYEIKGEDGFRIAAYQNASAAIDHLSSETKDMWDDGKLEEIPGVGAGIASYLDELFRTGKVKHFESLKKKVPPSVFEFMQISGVGPKTAFKLAINLNINQAKDAVLKLKKAGEENKISEIEGFGEKSQQDILEGIRNLKRGHAQENRMLLPYADALAHKIIDYLLENKSVIRADPLGSLRRKASTIGDIDISVATETPEESIAWFVAYPETEKLIERGPSGASILLKNGRQVDLRVQKPETYGSMLQYFTGSKQHNIKLREYALRMGISLSEHGIRITNRVENQRSRIKDQNYNSKLKIYEFKEERDFYGELGMDWIAPEMREGTGEINAALDGSLPKLVNLNDIKGDFHTHSNIDIEESHDPGESSMKAMINVAVELNYEYLGFSEHNPSASKHSDAEIMDLLKKKREAIDQLNYSSKKNTQGVFVFNGLEIDIKPNGELAMPALAFDLLDYAIVSIHSEFGMDRKTMTRRIIAALSAHPRVKIFGHPTGRKLGEREECQIDWDPVFEICRKKNIWLEINAYPNRLDLPDTIVREAVKNSVKMIINTDSHSAGQLDLMEYGVSVARRGWAEKKDIVNAQSCDTIKKELTGRGVN